MKLTGIQSGALLQRGADDLCRILLEAEFHGKPSASLGALTQLDETCWTLTGLPIGGPYTVTIADDDGAQTFTDLYVGDLWLLAGQSNMEGAGRITAEDMAYDADPLPNLRAYYMDDTWGAAKSILHNLFVSKDEAHAALLKTITADRAARKLTLYDMPPYPQRRAVGPGLYFAKELFRLTGGVPQGVIPAAVGGAPISMWLPQEDGTQNYYTAACRRLRETGSSIRGVFWSQGEGNPEADVYPAQIASIRADLCRRMRRDAPLPWVQLQSFRCTLDLSPASAMVWSRFREMQRRMPERAPLLTTIATNDLELDDCIHFSAESQRRAGIRAAKAMYRLMTGNGCAEPSPERIFVQRDSFVPQTFTDLHIRYANLFGDLRASGVPSGFALRKKGDSGEPSVYRFSRILLHRQEAILRIEFPAETLADYELWYGYGHCTYCNITDGDDRAIPAMGPLDLAEWLNEGEKA